MKDVTNRLLVLTRDAPMRMVESDLAEIGLTLESARDLAALRST